MHIFDRISSSGARLPRDISRRDLLKYSLAGAGVVALGPLGRLGETALGAPASLKRMVVVNLYGGCDTLNKPARPRSHY